MTLRNYSNTTTVGALTAPASPSDTLLSVGSFSNYPAAPFTATLDRNTVSEEIILVTAVNAGALTATRGYNGTAATTHLAGANVEHTAIALDFSDANTHVNSSANVHGASGDVVGSEGTQTLVDKTLVSALHEADNVLGDAVVAYVPEGAEARNLFRGMNPNGDDVITVDSAGQLVAARLHSTGNAEVDGTLTVDGATTLKGAVTIPAESASTSPVRKSTTDGINTRLTTAEGTLTAATAAATASTIAKRDAAGRLAVATPSATGDAATKGYVDGKDTAMDTRVDVLEADTGWVGLTPAANWVGGAMKYRMRGGFCTVTVNVGSTGTYTAGKTVTTLPVGARPSVALAPTGGYLDVLVPVDIATTGVITTANTSAASGLTFSTTFPIG